MSNIFESSNCCETLFVYTYDVNKCGNGYRDTIETVFEGHDINTCVYNKNRWCRYSEYDPHYGKCGRDSKRNKTKSKIRCDDCVKEKDWLCYGERFVSPVSCPQCSECQKICCP